MQTRSLDFEYFMEYDKKKTVDLDSLYLDKFLGFLVRISHQFFFIGIVNFIFQVFKTISRNDGHPFFVFKKPFHLYAVQPFG